MNQIMKALGASYLRCRVGFEVYGIEDVAVQEVLPYQKPTPIMGVPLFHKGVLHWRNCIVPVIDLRQKLGHDLALCSSVPSIVVLEVCGGLVGVLVDGVVISDQVLLIPEQIQFASELNACVDDRVLGVGLPEDGQPLMLLNIGWVVAGGFSRH